MCARTASWEACPSVFLSGRCLCVNVIDLRASAFICECVCWHSVSVWTLTLATLPNSCICPYLWAGCFVSAAVFIRIRVCVFSHSSDLHEQTTWCCVQMFSNSHTVRLENISRPVPDILFCHYHFKIIWQQQVLTFGKVSWEMIEITIWRRSMLR